MYIRLGTSIDGALSDCVYWWGIPYKPPCGLIFHPRLQWAAPVLLHFFTRAIDINYTDGDYKVLYDPLKGVFLSKTSFFCWCVYHCLDGGAAVMPRQHPRQLSQPRPPRRSPSAFLSFWGCLTADWLNGGVWHSCSSSQTFSESSPLLDQASDRE